MDIIISSPPANSKCLPITPRSDTDETWEGFQLELTRQNFKKKKKTWENDAGYLKKWWFHDEEDNNDDNDDNHSDDNDDNNDNDDNDNDN
jgi:hypothetical protein